MSERSRELLSLYDALIARVKSDDTHDNSMTVKELFGMVTKEKEYLLLKEQAKGDELDLVEQFLKRDIVSYLQEINDNDLSHSPTVLTAENTLWHWIAAITDRSQIEWHEILQDFKHQGYYKSGEVIGQGNLICTHCGHEVRIEFPGLISDCPQCDKGEFTREALAP